MVWRGLTGLSELGYKARQRGQVKGLGSERGEGNGACGCALSGLGNVFLGVNQGAALGYHMAPLWGCEAMADMS